MTNTGKLVPIAPANVIVPDGNWNQAGKMVRREKPLHSIPRVHLKIEKPSRYRLRSAAHDHWVATFEAVARALGAIEGGDIQDRLEYFFAIAVERILFLKGMLSRDAVTGGNSQEMIQRYQGEHIDPLEKRSD